MGAGVCGVWGLGGGEILLSDILAYYSQIPIGIYALAAVEEGIVVGCHCTLLRLVSKVDAIKETVEND